MATTGISYDQVQKRFILTTNTTAYVFQVTDDGTRPRFEGYFASALIEINRI